MLGEEIIGRDADKKEITTMVLDNFVIMKEEVSQLSRLLGLVG